ncbi:cysteine desulfurase family protein [Caulobacter sp. Root342]|uniref:cysteine desulfurase family protein n=1 Tax=Caulobacter sp. Root342 TaxID=1736519 RepID=UPI0006F69AF3|nr:cysteine desulfurase family protein [Caulobacter sp. Root342]KQV54663.1 hypothetical protein ASC62_23010 [Caulobacter sp. Root342]
MSAAPVYLDGYATNPLAQEAREAMFRALDRPANATSPHLDGACAARAVALARREVAELIGAAPSEVVFTSGATEANNLAILGVARQALAQGDPRRRLAVSAIEHKSVLEPAQALAELGFVVDILPVDRRGVVDLLEAADRISSETLLVSVMAANNETGVIQPISDLSAIAHDRGALFHCDAAQAAGKIAVDVVEWDVDYLSLSAHKLYGPMGVGALFVAATALPPQPMMFGGGQQKGMRSGTEPTPLLAGFGAAARVAGERLEVDAHHGQALAARLVSALAARQVRFSLITMDAPVLPGGISLSIEGAIGEDVVDRVADRVSLSTGSACTAGQVIPSHVLSAMNIDPKIMRSVVRIFCGRYLTASDIDLAATSIADVVARARLAPGGVHQ